MKAERAQVSSQPFEVVFARENIVYYSARHDSPEHPDKKSQAFMRCMYLTVLPRNISSVYNNPARNIPCICDILIKTIRVQNNPNLG